MKDKHLFGPVNSRRLGVSLGINLLPHKTCSLDCVYCECGKTTCLTVERKEYFSASEVIHELKEYLQQKPRLDYITFSGSGEPTLYSKIDVIIDFIKDNFPLYKIAVLTNSTLLEQQEVRAQLKRANLVVPSLDAVTESEFKKLNRPHNSLSCSKIITGLIKFRSEYSGIINLEHFIVPGINDNEKHLELLKKSLSQIKPDRIELNSLDRPGTEDWVGTIKNMEIKKIASYLGENVEIINKPPLRPGDSMIKNIICENMN